MFEGASLLRLDEILERDLSRRKQIGRTIIWLL